MLYNPGNILLVVCLLLAGVRPLSAQSGTLYVRPGDINYSGEVNLIDYLYLGYAYGAEGEPRPNASGAWGGPALENGQPVAAWEQPFPLGANFAHADCDGNGLIDMADTIWVRQNQGLTHNWGAGFDIYSGPGTPSLDPAIEIKPVPTTAAGGQQVTVDITVGDEAQPVNQLYGYTFTIALETPALVEDLSFAFPDDPWLFAGDDQVITQISTSADGTVAVALTRTDGLPVSGYGSLGRLSFVIIEDVVDAITVESILRLEKVLLIDHQLNPLDLVQFPESTITTRINDKASADLSIFPNPSRGELFVNDETQVVRQLRLLNSFGQPVYNERIAAASDLIPIDISALPVGWYVLEIQLDDHQMVMEKVFVTH